jgi:hypothetical protein
MKSQKDSAAAAAAAAALFILYHQGITEEGVRASSSCGYNFYGNLGGRSFPRHHCIMV